jgi:hypothetical protein
LQTFVRNRVAKINETTPECVWQHVRSQQNPADLVSRGMYPREILKSNLWWNGPDFLLNPELDWPVSEIQRVAVKDLPEVKTFVVSISDEEPPIIQNCSSITKLKQIFGYVVRFLRNISSKNDEERQYGPLNSDELQEGWRVVLRMVQIGQFSNEIKALRKGTEISNNSKLKPFSIFLDNEGIIRVGGRLRFSQLSQEEKHQIVLPNNHNLTKVMVRDIHIRNLYCSQRSLLSFVNRNTGLLTQKR